MMHDLRKFWSDESGSVISAELVTIGTVVTVGAVVGLQEASNTVHDEMRDVGKAIRNLNQSYSYRGFSGCYSMTAGSAFIDTNSGGLPRPQDPAPKPATPKTSDASPAEPEPDVTFLADESEAEEPLAEDNSPPTPAADKL
jgi:hypothetical protein